MLPPIVGHRGAAASAPENTLAGLRQAAAEGTTWVEVDARLAADGVPVVIHDATLERTTDGRGRVAKASAAALAALDATAGFRERHGWTGPPEGVPSLAALLAEARRLGLGVNVELKADRGQAAALADAAAPVLEAAGPVPLIVSSFARVPLERMRTRLPQLPLGMLARRLPRNWRRIADRLGCRAVHLGWKELRAPEVRAVKATGRLVAVYTVNDLETAERLRAWGVDIIITDRPGFLAGRALAASPAN